MGKGMPPAAKGDRHEGAGLAFWKSDETIVARRRVNKVNDQKKAAEFAERRVSAERNFSNQTEAGTQCPAPSEHGLTRVREAATWDRALRFNNLMHHLTLKQLERAYMALRKDAAAGVDGMDWHAPVRHRQC